MEMLLRLSVNVITGWLMIDGRRDILRAAQECPVVAFVAYGGRPGGHRDLGLGRRGHLHLRKGRGTRARRPVFPESSRISRVIG